MVVRHPLIPIHWLVVDGGVEYALLPLLPGLPDDSVLPDHPGQYLSSSEHVPLNPPPDELLDLLVQHQSIEYLLLGIEHEYLLLLLLEPLLVWAVPD